MKELQLIGNAKYNIYVSKNYKNILKATPICA